MTYRADGSCTIGEAGQLLLMGTGRCTLTALQAGDADHAPAPEVSRSFAVQSAAAQPTAEPTRTPEPSMAELAWPLPCETWQEATSEPFIEGALEAIECHDETTGIARYVLYRFPDTATLAAHFTEQVAAARPPLGVTEDACAPGTPGVRTWEHGWLACWVPEGTRMAQLHWTDERTSTYGVLELTDGRLPRAYRRWSKAYGAEATAAPDG